MQRLYMITNKSIFIVQDPKNITLLYTITPIGVGGNFFNATLFHSKIGPGDKDFLGKFIKKF